MGRTDGARRTAARRSGRRRRCLQAGRASAPRSSPRSRSARAAGRPRPRCIMSGAATPGTARTTWPRSATSATRGSRTRRPDGCRRRDRPGAWARGQPVPGLRDAGRRLGGPGPTARLLLRPVPVEARPSAGAGGDLAQRRGADRRASVFIPRSRTGKRWVGASGAGRYPLQTTTLRGTPHPPLAARRPALAAVRCQAGRGRVHRCAGGPRRPDPPAALSGPRSAPPPWRRCWTTRRGRIGRMVPLRAERSGGPCGCRVTRCGAATGQGGGCRAASDPEPGWPGSGGPSPRPGSARPGRAGLLACPLADRPGRGLNHVSEAGWSEPCAGVQGRICRGHGCGVGWPRALLPVLADYDVHHLLDIESLAAWSWPGREWARVRDRRCRAEAAAPRGRPPPSGSGHAAAR